MRRPIYIYGAGGLGREVLAMLRMLEEWEPMGFIDDNIPTQKTLKGLPILAGVGDLHDLALAAIVIAVGDPMAREKIGLRLPKDVLCPVIKHPTAQLVDEHSIKIGKGCILCAGVVLTTDISLGDHVLVNLNTTIGHDSSVGSYSAIMPSVNIAGSVTVGECVLLGSGSNIRNGVQIGNKSKVGMGAVVIKNVQEGDTVVGVPAKPV
jgi:sugar O-acyltransferase (sialic acid O-acetyltransferase NeuD family)